MAGPKPWAAAVSLGRKICPCSLDILRSCLFWVGKTGYFCLVLLKISVALIDFSENRVQPIIQLGINGPLSHDRVGRLVDENAGPRS